MEAPLHATPRIPGTALFRLALYYGVAGFGGGYSVLAQLRRELVEVRGWIDAEEFLVLAELSKSLPGTPATSLIALLRQRVGAAPRRRARSCRMVAGAPSRVSTATDLHTRGRITGSRPCPA